MQKMRSHVIFWILLSLAFGGGYRIFEIMSSVLILFVILTFALLELNSRHSLAQKRRKLQACLIP